jgi:hypothetical protein
VRAEELTPVSGIVGSIEAQGDSPPERTLDSGSEYGVFGILLRYDQTRIDTQRAL